MIARVNRSSMSMRIVALAASLSAVCIHVGAGPSAAWPHDRPPNVILIVCDNLGYGDIGCYNPRAKQRTPHVDQMAAEGMKFTDCYAAAPVCTPSRAALMTGCYPRRVGLDYTDGRDALVLRPVSHYGLNPSEITIAELLKTRGYATACIGKWHLGDQPEFLPTSQGFDSYLGIPYSDDMVGDAGRGWPPLPLLEGEQVIEAPVDRNRLTQRFTEQAIRFIQRHCDQPFFIYLAHAMPGSTAAPFASDTFRGASANGPWGDAVEEIDWSTGQILDSLLRLDLDRQTLVIWTNDNGAPAPARRGGSNLPLKGNAYGISEGGMRVPFLARWPGRIPAAAVCREMITLMDLLPTLAQLAGAPPVQDRVIDGHDIRPLLFAQPAARTPYDAFFFYYANQLRAVRSGPWKLYLEQGRNPGGVSGEAAGTTAPRLYDLVRDPEETTNLVKQQADVAERLLAMAQRARQDLGELGHAGAHVRPVGRVEHPTPRVLPQPHPNAANPSRHLH